MRAPWYLRALALAFLICCGCLSASKQSIKVDADSASTISRSQEETLTKTVKTGPSLTLDFAPLEPTGQPTDSARPSPATAQIDTGGSARSYAATADGATLARSSPDGLPPHGALLKATFTGPSVAELVAVAHMQTHEQDDLHLKAKAEKQEESRWGPRFWTLFAIGFALGSAAMLGVYLLWRTKPPVLNALWKLLP